MVISSCTERPEGYAARSGLHPQADRDTGVGAHPEEEPLTQIEIERQKYQKLSSARERVAKAVARQEARELDEIGGQLHYRKSKLA